MDTILLHETQTFSPIYIASQWVNAHSLIIEACETYQKRSFRNKYYIATNQGIQLLSIPLLKGKHNQQSIRDVKIAYYEPWVDKHLRAIKSAYGNAPYFEHYYTKIEQIFSRRHTFLFDFNQEIMSAIIKWLNLEIKLDYTQTFEIMPNDLVDYRNALIIDTHIGLGYQQVWNLAGLSDVRLWIMDTLFCVGNETTVYLQQLSQKIILQRRQNK